MRRRVLAKWLFELVALYVGWGLLDYAKALLTGIYASSPLTLNATVFGTIGIVAIVVAAILGTLLVQDLVGSARARKGPRRVTQQFETFLGQDELVRELERVAAWCEQFRDKTISAQDVSQVTRELDRLWIELVELRSKYGGVWTVTLKNEVTTVANQLQAASSVLSKRLGEKTKAHVEGAHQDAKSLIRELKVPPSS